MMEHSIGITHFEDRPLLTKLLSTLHMRSTDTRRIHIIMYNIILAEIVNIIY